MRCAGKNKFGITNHAVMFCKLQKVHNSRTILYLPITENVFSHFTLSKAEINLELITVIPTDQRVQKFYILSDVYLIFSPNYLPMIECWWSCRLQCQLLSMCKENSYSRQKPKWSNLTKFLSKQYGLLRLNSSSQNIVRRLETLWQVVTTFHKNRDMFHNIKINLPFGFAFMTKPPYN